MNTGDRIKQRRIELGLTADELAKKIGKSRATIYRYENGDIENMPTPILVPLAKALDTTPADLMGWGKTDSTSISNATPKKSDTVLETLKFCGPQKELNSIYEKLSTENQNKVLQYSKNLLSTQQMEEALLADAASARTDITVFEGTDTSDNDIMDDENF